MPANLKPSDLIEESGHFVPDGELDLIRIPPGSVEAYHVELARGQRFRFAIAASSLITIRLANDPEDRDGYQDSPALYPAFDRVDLHHFTFRAPRTGSFIVSLENPASRPVDVAVFFRTLALPTRERVAHQRRVTKAKAALGRQGEPAGNSASSRPPRTVSHP